jgi:hypothetical protein
MADVSEAVRRFFNDYVKAADSLDLAFLGSAYSDSFLFAGPSGTQTVKRDDFLRVLPRRKDFFLEAGLTSSLIQSLEETRLDDSYVMVKTRWSMRFEKVDPPPVLLESSATYVLRREGDAVRIVFQLDHQDLMQRIRDLGLIPAAT